MSNLFTYGCSFTLGNGCLPYDQYYKEYRKSEDDLIWPEIVAKELGLTLFNHGMGAFSNDKILDSMIESFDEVQEGDIVIIQKTFTHRFDITYRREKNEPYARRGLTVTPHCEELLKQQGYDDSEVRSIMETVWLMDGEFNDMRVDNRFNFMKRLFLSKRVQKCLVWNVLNYHDKRNYERIQEATNEEIVDAHWSYKGHRAFANVMLNKIKTAPLEIATIKKIV
jgi:hypothetical protein